MRILIAVHGYPPTHNGGAERRAQRTAQALAALGHSVRVLCVETLAGPTPGIYQEDDYDQTVLVRRLFCNFSADKDPFQLSYDNPYISHALWELIREWQPDLMHLFSGYLMSASCVNTAHAAGIPIVISLTDYWWLCHRINLLRTDESRCSGPTPLGCARCHAESRRRYRLPAQVLPYGADLLWSAIERTPMSRYMGLAEQQRRRETLMETLGRAAALIAPSQFTADVYRNHGASPDRLHVIRQGVNLGLCPLHIPSDQLRVGYLGQIKSHKGVHTLIQAWSRLQGDRPRFLHIYGSAHGEPAYAAEINALLKLTSAAAWHGELHGGGTWQALASLDVLVMPVRWYENSPNIVLEAQAMGVPVIATAIGGLPELINHEQNGLLVPPDNAEALTAALQRLIDEPDLLPHLRRHQLPFRTMDHEINDLLAVYESILGPEHIAPEPQASPDLIAQVGVV